MYRIMIVDDEPSILSALSRMLEDVEEWDLETYDCAADGLKRAQTATFDVFVSDYRMPDMNGVEFLTEAKKLQPESMRIILSGFTDLEALLGAINTAEIFRFICKPWDDSDLIETLKHALTYRDTLVENRMLADQLRNQRQELDKRKMVVEKLVEQHPTSIAVDWAEDGTMIIDESFLDN